MNSSLPTSERVTAMVITLITNVELTTTQKLAIRSKLSLPMGRPKAKFCKRGHARTPDNVRGRRCMICSREDNRRYKARRRVPNHDATPRRKTPTCDACRHAKGLHGEDGYCYHKSNGDFDCECTGVQQ